jgi:hypothetical protein
MPYIHVDLDEFSDDEIMEAAQERGLIKAGEYVTEAELRAMVEKIYLCRIFKVDDTDYVRELVDRVLGRIL